MDDASRRSDVVCGLRDCATRYRFLDQPLRARQDGLDLRPLEDAFFRAERITADLLAKVADCLRSKRPDRSTIEAVLALQEREADLLDRLRSSSIRTALAAADAVVGAWVGPMVERRAAVGRWDDLFLGATFLLRCAAPTRFPIVAVPYDLLQGRIKKWKDCRQFLEAYHVQVWAIQHVARAVGMLVPMRLHDGIQQFSRCAAEGHCKARRAGEGACAGERLLADFDQEGQDASRRKVLERLREILRLQAVTNAGDTLQDWLEGLLPSEHELVEGLQVMHFSPARETQPQVHNLLDGLEHALRVRLAGAGRKMARELDTIARVQRGDAVLQEEEHGQRDADGLYEQRRRDRRKAPDTPAEEALPSARQVAEAIFTPKTTVDRILGLTMDEALKRAKTPPTKRRRRKQA